MTCKISSSYLERCRHAQPYSRRGSERDYWVLLLAGGVERTGGDGCFNAGCRTALGVGGGEGCLIAGYIEALTGGTGLIVTSTSGIGVVVQFESLSRYLSA